MFSPYFVTAIMVVVLEELSYIAGLKWLVEVACQY
jgi:hypothetical protein